MADYPLDYRYSVNWIAVHWHTQTVKTPEQVTKSTTLKSNFPPRQRNVQKNFAERIYVGSYGEKSLHILKNQFSSANFIMSDSHISELRIGRKDL